MRQLAALLAIGKYYAGRIFRTAVPALLKNSLRSPSLGRAVAVEFDPLRNAKTARAGENRESRCRSGKIVSARLQGQTNEVIATATLPDEIRMKVSALTCDGPVSTIDECMRSSEASVRIGRFNGRLPQLESKERQVVDTRIYCRWLGLEVRTELWQE
jgi:hypothetical protein